MSLGRSLPAVHKLPTTVIGWDPQWTLRSINHCPRREWSRTLNCIFFLIFQRCIFEALLSENYFVSSDPHSTIYLSHYHELSTTYTTGWHVLRSVCTKLHGVIIRNFVIFIFKLQLNFALNWAVPKTRFKTEMHIFKFVSLPRRPDAVWGTINLCLFPEVKAARAWSCPFPYIKCRSSGCA